METSRNTPQINLRNSYLYAVWPTTWNNVYYHALIKSPLIDLTESVVVR